MSETKMIPFNEIRLDGGTQCRECIDQDVVKQYKSEMLSNDKFPPIQTVFDGYVHWLWDGFHRYHAIKSIGVTQVEVECRSGTQEDAQDLALSANGKHGLSRTNADKRKAVETALSMARHANKSDREVAKLCNVSQPFVGSMRNPKVKRQQAKNVARHYESKASKGEESEIQFHPDSPEGADEKPDPNVDYGPSEDELRANEMSMIADQKILTDMLESDDKLAMAFEEIKRLNYLVAQTQIRIGNLMTEKNEAIRDAKRAQASLDRMWKVKT